MLRYVRTHVAWLPLCLSPVRSPARATGKRHLCYAGCAAPLLESHGHNPFVNHAIANVAAKPRDVPRVVAALPTPERRSGGAGTPTGSLLTCTCDSVLRLALDRTGRITQRAFAVRAAHGRVFAMA
jgi:hypothetical protein